MSLVISILKGSMVCRTVTSHLAGYGLISDWIDVSCRINEIFSTLFTGNHDQWRVLGRKIGNCGTGAEGMSPEQVVRVAIVKQTEDYRYDELASHIVDSSSHCVFCRIGTTHKGFKKSALCHHITALSAETLMHYIRLTLQVVDQTERRVIHGESVSASEKIVSLFEPHTDIIVKDNRDTLYGHKLCLTGGSSNLIVDCVICDGNRADATLTDQVFDRQHEIYGRYPVKAILDGGFATKANLKFAKSKNIKGVCFAKKIGIAVEDVSQSMGLQTDGRFRAGVESGISWLKRCFGFRRCTWKGLESFKS